jgi:branched-chain amino acid transport system permease protein
LVSCAIGLFGLVILIELLYHLTLESASGTEMRLFGQIVDTAATSSWLVGLVLLLVGLAGFLLFRSRFMAIWSDVNAEIEKSAVRGGR